MKYACVITCVCVCVCVSFYAMLVFITYAIVVSCHVNIYLFYSLLCTAKQMFRSNVLGTLNNSASASCDDSRSVS